MERGERVGGGAGRDNAILERVARDRATSHQGVEKVREQALYPCRGTAF